MNLDTLKYVHFIGIGGIGMSALARYFNQTGKTISGYDKTETDLTRLLEKEGMTIYFEESESLIPTFVKDASENERLIIYTPAVPENHVEIQYFKSRDIALYKRAEVLGILSSSIPTVAVAGTHGKTSTTSILAYILLKSKMEFVGFIGGINENFGSNLVIQGQPKLMLTEADEYDRSFLKLSPKYALITSMDPDHLDIYLNAESIKDGFISFSKLVSDSGVLLVEENISSNFDQDVSLSYGLKNSASAHSKEVQMTNDSFIFDYEDSDGCIEKIHLNLPGLHNLENCIGAIALARKIGVDDNAIKLALSTYKGVKRRFEIHISHDDFSYIDDYAHHPKEIEAVVGSLNSMYPSKRITAVFQPHLFSRTRDFGDEFARSLELIDDIILLDIYPAREKPIDGIDSNWLLSKIQNQSKCLSSKDDLVELLWDKKPEILLTIGAGDIDQLVQPIIQKFAK